MVPRRCSGMDLDHEEDEETKRVKRMRAGKTGKDDEDEQDKPLTKSEKNELARRIEMDAQAKEERARIRMAEARRKRNAQAGEYYCCHLRFPSPHFIYPEIHGRRNPEIACDAQSGYGCVLDPKGR